MSDSVRNAVFIGIDLGTSGVRACALDARGQVCAEARSPLPSPKVRGAAVEQDPALWWSALRRVLREMAPRLIDRRPRALLVDGTSATLLAVDAAGEPLGPALMYNDGRAVAEAARIAEAAPAQSPGRGASSALAKCLWLLERQPGLHGVLHQADWIAGRLTGRFGRSDENNALKLGYDPAARAWPDWLDGLGVDRRILPAVSPPGTPWGPIQRRVAQELGLPEGVEVLAGATDSTAAFVAAGARQPGEGVTVLGSTLVIKLLSERPIWAQDYGIYSHRLGNLWICGGASNSGAALLLDFFTPEQLRALTPRLRPESPTGLNYYPLRRPGERFPVNDPGLAPRLEPRPDDPARFLQGLFEGMAEIEAQGYARLEALGAPRIQRVRTTGGGSVNPAWTLIRKNRLGVPVGTAEHTEAAYGSARLAMESWGHGRG